MAYTINPTIIDEKDWTIGDTYTDTFSEFTTTPTCDDLTDIDYILYSAVQQGGSSVNYFQVTDSTRTIDTTSLPTYASNAMDRNVYDLTVYAFFPDGKCLAD